MTSELWKRVVGDNNSLQARSPAQTFRVQRDPFETGSWNASAEFTVIVGKCKKFRRTWPANLHNIPAARHIGEAIAARVENETTSFMVNTLLQQTWL